MRNSIKIILTNCDGANFEGGEFRLDAFQKFNALLVFNGNRSHNLILMERF